MPGLISQIACDLRQGEEVALNNRALSWQPRLSDTGATARKEKI